MSCYAAAVDSMAAHDGPPPQELLLQLPPMPMSIPAAAAGIPPPAQQPPPPPPQQSPFKRKRSLPGTPDPEAEVIALSPKTLMATNRFVCEICNKGFQRDQNLQLHRRGHNLPWKLRQRSSNEEQQLRKRVYVCPEPSCVHHDPSRALGDLTGIKKHFCRKHGEKKWKCDKCSKRYAVYSDWKAHSKICGTREYRCDCGTLFSRRDSFITHRAFCDSLAAVDDSGRGAGASLSADLPLPLDFTRNISPFYHQRSHNNNNNNSNNNNNTTAGVSSISGSIGLNTMQIMQSLHMDSSANFFLQYLSSGGGAPNVNSNRSGSSSSNMLRYQYQYQYQADSNNSRFLSSSSHNPAQESLPLPLPPPPDNKFHHHHHEQQQQESLSAMALLMQRNGHMASSLSAAPGGSSSANTMFMGLGLLGSDSSKSNSTSSSSSNHHLNHNQTHSHSHSRQQQHHHHINNKNQDHHQPQQQWQHNNNQYMVQEDENNNPAAAAEEAASRDLVQQWHWQWLYHNRQVSVDAAAAAHLVSGADDAEGTRDFLSVAMAPSHDFTREAETEIEAEVERAGPFHGRPPPPPPYLAVHLPPHISPGNLSSSSSSFEKIPSL